MKLDRSRLIWWCALLVFAPFADAAEAVRVVCLGDSITFGSRAPNPAEECYPTQLQHLLGGVFEVKNLGAPGATLWHGGGRNAFQQLPAAKQFAPQIAIVMFGINDTRSDRTQYWSHFSEFEADATKLIEALLALPSRPRVLLCLPTSSVPEMPGLTSDRVAVLRERIPRLDAVRAVWRMLAQRYARRGVELVDLAAATENRADLHSDDAVHFNPAGYRFLAETLKPRVLAAAARP